MLHSDEREQFVSLDYDKLKIELQLVEGNQKALILQALRWVSDKSHIATGMTLILICLI